MNAQCRRFGLRGGHGYARLQASYHGQSVAPAVCLRRERKWNVDIHMRAGREYRAVVEGGRQNAGNCRRSIVERDRAADNMRVAGKVLLPVAVAEQNCLGTVPFAFVGGEGAP